MNLLNPSGAVSHVIIESEIKSEISRPQSPYTPILIMETQEIFETLDLSEL
jgi:hypothetical protein